MVSVRLLTITKAREVRESSPRGWSHRGRCRYHQSVTRSEARSGDVLSPAGGSISIIGRNIFYRSI